MTAARAVIRTVDPFAEREDFVKGPVRIVARITLVAALLATFGTGSRAGATPPLRNELNHRARDGGMPHLQYWGGSVLTNVKVVVVLWGSGHYTAQVSRTTAPNVASFFTAVTASPYVDWLREYNPRNAKIGRGSVAARVVITPATVNNGSRIDDVTNLRPELLHQIRAGRLPAPDANTLYAIFFPSGRVITQGGSDSANGFCAYHSTVRLSRSRNVRYAVLPATAAGRKCGPAPGFGNLGIAASHELAEAITDPDVGLATRVGPPLGWYDPLYGEIADICAGNATTLIGADGRAYTVQKLWSNRRQACVAS